jgi:anaphase-promoting complex subunit 2
MYYANACFKADASVGEIQQCTGCNQETGNCQCQMIIYMFHETNRKLIELELLERLVGNVLTSLIHIRIENHVTQTCDKTFDVSQLIPLENVCSGHHACM